MRVKILFSFKLFLFVLLVTGMIACNKEDKHNKAITVRIASVKKIMTGGITYSPYFAKVEGLPDWQSFDAISGFDFEDGHEYELRIWQEKWHNGEIQDASIYRYKLLDILSKVEKDSEDIPNQYVYVKVAPEKSPSGSYYVWFVNKWEEVEEINNFNYEPGYEYSIGVYASYQGKEAIPTYKYTWDQTFDKKEKGFDLSPDSF